MITPSWGHALPLRQILGETRPRPRKRPRQYNGAVGAVDGIFASAAAAAAAPAAAVAAAAAGLQAPNVVHHLLQAGSWTADILLWQRILC